MKALIFSLTVVTLLFFSGLALSQEQNKDTEKGKQLTTMMQDSVMVGMMMDHIANNKDMRGMMMDKMMNVSDKDCKAMMSMCTMMMNDHSQMHGNMENMMDHKTKSDKDDTNKRPRNSKTHPH